MVEQRKMIGEILVDLGLVAQEDIDAAIQDQMSGNSKRLGEILVEKEILEPADVTMALAEQHQMEVVDLDSLEIPREIIEVIPSDKARQLKIIPIDLDGNNLTVAIADPLDIFSLDELRFLLNMQIEPILASPEAIEDALNRYYGIDESQVEKYLTEFTDDIELVEFGEKDDGSVSEDDAPVIKLVTLIMLNALKNRASDIHVEPMANRLRLRYRIDGVCYEQEPPPKRLQGPIIARIKIMANMDMAEKRRPQDGRIKISLLGRELDLRVSSLPATHGESVVMRILDKESLLLGLTDLGFMEDDYSTFQGLIKKPNGIILVTGPTGSGKTTTLYAALNELNKPDRKIITAENPVEYVLSGVNQCDVKEKIGFTFQRILRAMMRQAPNIILVGEIRDEETAEMAIHAALTGHLVFSTLHTNDAPSAITRLIDMGVAPFLAASSIQAVMAQRLVRNICKECKTPAEEDLPKLKSLGFRDDQLKGKMIYKGMGCDACRGVGFRGRKGIFEVMVMNNKLRELAFNKSPTDAIRNQAINDGMHTLFMDGVRKVLDGITTLEEIIGVAKVEV
ncbi:MAG: Flp pilus assembly complex ATPase component TadA [Planctomycetes bacterium]|nr:Flp pilus assembly complex ATPase component TadA [Planctomycetota bacterium]